MSDIGPKKESHRNRIYLRKNEVLTAEIESLKADRDHHKDQVSKLLSDSVPKLVKNWMLEYGQPWQLFWCYEHSQWIEELDSMFPYDTVDNRCSSCK